MVKMAVAFSHTGRRMTGNLTNNGVGCASLEKPTDSGVAERVWADAVWVGVAVFEASPPAGGCETGPNALSWPTISAREDIRATVVLQLAENH